METTKPEYFTESDRLYMLRALSLAANGLGTVSPNPMVGAVIVGPDGTVLGEGYHRRFGGPHAEINAIHSVSPEHLALLSQSTVYVTLEPCSHYGKTPPCSVALCDKGFRRVVVGATDPFDKVAGRGIGMLREHGIDVAVGLMEDECRSLNARFFSAHELRRPFVTLKWAQSMDGFMDYRRNFTEKAKMFSNPLGLTLVHRLRAHHDAIAVGSGTYLSDSPRLDVRLWHGDNPRRIVFDRRGRCGAPTPEIPELLSNLYEEGITSLLVEGGPSVLSFMIENGLWDLARVEVAPYRLENAGTAPTPVIGRLPFTSHRIERNTIYYYSNNPLVNNFFVANGL